MSVFPIRVPGIAAFAALIRLRMGRAASASQDPLCPL